VKRFFRSLRIRLIVSHMLPLLVVLPVVGIALTYLLETQVLIADASKELERQASLVATVAADYPLIWLDETQAQTFTARIGPLLTAQVTLLDTNGMLLASTDAADQGKIGQQMNVTGLNEALSSGRAVRVDYGAQPGTGAAEVLVPVSINRVPVGVIRLTDPLSRVYERFPRTRTLILGVLVGSLLLGLAIGVGLAVDLERPLQRATRAITHMADGQPLATLPEQGPEDVRLLVRAFNALTEQLRNLELSRRKLLANLVHEIGRPLGALLSAIQALGGGAYAQPELRQELLSGMEGEVQRMRRLLDDLTRLYDQSSGKLQVTRQPTPLAPWLAQTVGPWREAARERELRWQTCWDELPTVPIDPDRLAQALGNVLSNAIKYTPAGGEVEVSAGAEGGEAWIRVRDTGPGIPPEEQERVFAPFYRGGAGGRFPQGMGLGLGIAREIVQAHGGRIELHSVVGQGSAFTLRLPTT
jgi:two-component system, OmpR family, sensor histidine kinase BaeS